MKKTLVMLLSAAMILSLAVPAAASETATEGETYEFNCGLVVGENSAPAEGLRTFADLVYEKSGGRIQITPVYDNLLGTNNDLPQIVASGSAQMAVSNTAGLSTFLPDYGVFDLPYMVTDEEKAEAVLDGEAGRAMLDKLEAIGLHGLTFFRNGFRDVQTANREVNSPEDMKGLKLRTLDSEVMLDIFNTLGCAAVAMNWPEVYSSLQTGVIDAQENPIDAITNNSMWDVDPYCTKTHHTYAVLCFYMTDEIWQSMSPEDQEIMTSSALEAVKVERERSKADAEKGYELFKENGGTVIEIEDLTPWVEATQPVYDHFAANYDQDFIAAMRGEGTEESGETAAVEPVTEGESYELNCGLVVNEASAPAAGLRKFAELVSERTGGRIQITPVYDNLLGTNNDLPQIVASGSAQMAVSNTAGLSTFLPDYGVFDLPYMVTDEEKAEEVLDGEPGRAMLDKLEAIGLHGLTFFRNGFRDLETANREVYTPEDMKGLKLRTLDSEVMLDIFNTLGCAAVAMNWPEVYSSLQTGVIDAQENPIDAITNNSMWDVDPYCTKTHHTYAVLCFYMTDELWQSMSPEDQEIMTQAALEAVQYEREISKADAEKGYELFKENGGTVIEVEDYTPWVEATQPVYDHFAANYDQDFISAMRGE